MPDGFPLDPGGEGGLTTGGSTGLAALVHGLAIQTLGPRSIIGQEGDSKAMLAACGGQIRVKVEVWLAAVDPAADQPIGEQAQFTQRVRHNVRLLFNPVGRFLP